MWRSAFWAQSGLVTAALLMALLPDVEGVTRKTGNHRRQSADHAMRLKRVDCERTVCAGLTAETKLSCIYRCISEVCHDEIYAHDELEEGEIDIDRGRQFSHCYRRMFRQEQDQRDELVRKEAAERRAEAAQRRAELQRRKDAATN
mmetsp:Transcript_23546/g.47998  ORF Transcript_23546/g.47998 Transcript_23546/m.47998 type:complete len:146 (+) Transcript_23546:133-570(+)